MLPLKLSNALVPMMTQKENARRHAVSRGVDEGLHRARQALPLVRHVYSGGIRTGGEERGWSTLAPGQLL